MENGIFKGEIRHPSIQQDLIFGLVFWCGSLAQTVLTGTSLIALFFAGATDDISECFSGGAHFLFHCSSIEGIALLLLRGLPASPVAAVCLGTLLASVAPVLTSGCAGLAAGFFEKGKLPSKVNGSFV
jgi:hypothetical protein